MVLLSHTAFKSESLAGHQLRTKRTSKSNTWIEFTRQCLAHPCPPNHEMLRLYSAVLRSTVSPHGSAVWPFRTLVTPNPRCVIPPLLRRTSTEEANRRTSWKRSPLWRSRRASAREIASTFTWNRRRDVWIRNSFQVPGEKGRQNILWKKTVMNCMPWVVCSCTLSTANSSVQFKYWVSFWLCMGLAREQLSYL